MTRLPIAKTPKVYVGGAFIRSESGRTFPIKGADGKFFANIPQCTRKDLRNAVEAAAKAGPGWARRTPYNRGQILYRLGEMLEARKADMTDALTLGAATPLGSPKLASGGGSSPSTSRNGGTTRPASFAKPTEPRGGRVSKSSARREIAATVDRLIYYAGWADKYEQVLGNVNPVASPHFNFTVTEPMGIVGVIAPEEAPLLGLISLIAPVIVSGNTVVALASTTQPYPAIVLGEMLATSDLPGGVVNLLTGFRKELLPTFATHTHLRGLAAVANADERKTLKLGAAESVKRTHLLKSEEPRDWFKVSAQSLYAIRDFLEVKTTWHPIGA